MLLLRLWNYIRGYVIIIVEGYFLEKFINICIRRQIFLWDIKKQKNSRMSMKVSIKGFKLLKPIAKKTGCRVRITRKRGIPFVLYRYKSRKTFIAGAVVFVFLFYFMTSFVWTVEVVGNKKVETQLILEKVTDFGVKPGIFKYGIDTHDVANNLMLDLNDLSWVSVVVKGTKVKIVVAEAVSQPPLVPKDIPCDIIASKDGVIKTILVNAGHEAVKVGDTVKKGDVLISGTVPVKNQEDNPKTVHAIGSVEARTWYEGRQKIETKVVEKFRTGEKKDNISLVLFSKKIDLFHKKEPFGDYDQVNIEKNLCIGEDLILPFGLVIERYFENNVTEKEIDLDEAKKIAADNAYNESLKDIPQDAKIVNSSVGFIEKEDGQMFADVIIECIEDIGYQKEIGGN